MKRAASETEPRKRRVPGRLWPIADRALLRQLVRAAIDERFGGSQRRAAAETGLSSAWISRVLNEATTPTEVQIDTLVALRRLLVEADDDAYVDLLLPDASSPLFRAYSAWIEHSIEQASIGTGSWLTNDVDGTKSEEIVRDEDGQTQLDRERAALLVHVAAIAPDIKERMELLAKQLNPHRWLVSLSRILDLLVTSPQAGFAEPWWRTMHADDVREVVRKGLEREELLLQGWSSLDQTLRSSLGRARPIRRKKR
jgi:hypothetical protein